MARKIPKPQQQFFNEFDAMEFLSKKNSLYDVSDYNEMTGDQKTKYNLALLSNMDNKNINSSLLNSLQLDQKLDYLTLAAGGYDNYVKEQGDAALSYNDLVNQIKQTSDYIKAQNDYDNLSRADKFWTSLLDVVITPFEAVYSGGAAIADLGAYIIALPGKINEEAGGNWTYHKELEEFIRVDKSITEIKYSDPNSPFFASQANSYYNSNSWNITNISKQVLDSITHIGIATGLNMIAPGSGAWYFTTRIAGGNVQKVETQYADEALIKQLAYITAATTVEMVLENNLGWTMGGIPQGIVRTMLEEGLEEVFQDLSNAYLEQVIFSKGDLQQKLNPLNVDINFEDLLQSFVIGGLVGGISGLSNNIVLRTEKVAMITDTGSEISVRRSAVIAQISEFNRLNTELNTNKTLSADDQIKYNKLTTTMFKLDLKNGYSIITPISELANFSKKSLLSKKHKVQYEKLSKASLTDEDVNNIILSDSDQNIIKTVQAQLLVGLGKNINSLKQGNKIDIAKEINNSFKNLSDQVLRLQTLTGYNINNDKIISNNNKVVLDEIKTKDKHILGTNRISGTVQSPTLEFMIKKDLAILKNSKRKVYFFVAIDNSVSPVIIDANGDVAINYLALENMALSKIQEDIAAKLFAVDISKQFSDEAKAYIQNLAIELKLDYNSKVNFNEALYYTIYNNKLLSDVMILSENTGKSIIDKINELAVQAKIPEAKPITKEVDTNLSNPEKIAVTEAVRTKDAAIVNIVRTQIEIDRLEKEITFPAGKAALALVDIHTAEKTMEVFSYVSKADMSAIRFKNALNFFKALNFKFKNDPDVVQPIEWFGQIFEKQNWDMTSEGAKNFWNLIGKQKDTYLDPSIDRYKDKVLTDNDKINLFLSKSFGFTVNIYTGEVITQENIENLIDFDKLNTLDLRDTIENNISITFYDIASERANRLLTVDQMKSIKIDITKIIMASKKRTSHGLNFEDNSILVGNIKQEIDKQTGEFKPVAAVETVLGNRINIQKVTLIHEVGHAIGNLLGLKKYYYWQSAMINVARFVMSNKNNDQYKSDITKLFDALHVSDVDQKRLMSDKSTYRDIFDILNKYYYAIHEQGANYDRLALTNELSLGIEYMGTVSGKIKATGPIFEQVNDTLITVPMVLLQPDISEANTYLFDNYERSFMNTYVIYNERIGKDIENELQSKTKLQLKNDSIFKAKLKSTISMIYSIPPSNITDEHLYNLIELYANTFLDKQTIKPVDKQTVKQESEDNFRKIKDYLSQQNNTELSDQDLLDPKYWYLNSKSFYGNYKFDQLYITAYSIKQFIQQKTGMVFMNNAWHYDPTITLPTEKSKKLKNDYTTTKHEAISKITSILISSGFSVVNSIDSLDQNYFLINEKIYTLPVNKDIREETYIQGRLIADKLDLDLSKTENAKPGILGLRFNEGKLPVNLNVEGYPEVISRILNKIGIARITNGKAYYSENTGKADLGKFIAQIQSLGINELNYHKNIEPTISLIAEENEKNLSKESTLHTKPILLDNISNIQESRPLKQQVHLKWRNQQSKAFRILQQIAEDYNITDIEAFRSLGFSDKFIEDMKNYKGMTITYINDVINGLLDIDNSSIEARNLLIEYKYPLNNTIRTIEDCDKFFNILPTYLPYIHPQVAYYSWDELETVKRTGKVVNRADSQKVIGEEDGKIEEINWANKFNDALSHERNTELQYTSLLNHNPTLSISSVKRFIGNALTEAGFSGKRSEVSDIVVASTKEGEEEVSIADKYSGEKELEKAAAKELTDEQIFEDPKTAANKIISIFTKDLSELIDLTVDVMDSRSLEEVQYSPKQLEILKTYKNEMSNAISILSDLSITIDEYISTNKTISDIYDLLLDVEDSIDLSNDDIKYMHASLADTIGTFEDYYNKLDDEQQTAPLTVIEQKAKQIYKTSKDIKEEIDTMSDEDVRKYYKKITNTSAGKYEFEETVPNKKDREEILEYARKRNATIITNITSSLSHTLSRLEKTTLSKLGVPQEQIASIIEILKVERSKIIKLETEAFDKSERLNKLNAFLTTKKGGKGFTDLIEHLIKKQKLNTDIIQSFIEQNLKTSSIDEEIKVSNIQESRQLSEEDQAILDEFNAEETVTSEDTTTEKPKKETKQRTEYIEPDKVKQMKYGPNSPLLSKDAKLLIGTDFIDKYFPVYSGQISEEEHAKSNSAYFLKENGPIINRLVDNETDSRNFIEWFKNTTYGPHNREYIAASIIVNQIRIYSIYGDISSDAQKLIERDKSMGGRFLSLHGNVTSPIDNIVNIARSLPLTATEHKTLKDLAAREKIAYANDDFKAAAKIQEEALELIGKYDPKTGGNFWQKGISKTERKRRLAVALDRADRFRYLAMLGKIGTIPKNWLTNKIANAADKVTGFIANKIIGKLPKVSNEKGYNVINKAGDKSKNIVDKLLVENGMIEAILNGQIKRVGAEYVPVGYKTFSGKYESDLAIEEGKPIDTEELSYKDEKRLFEINRKLKPFGTSMIGEILNKADHLIYRSKYGMTTQDKVEMSKHIRELMAKFIENNFTEEEKDMLLSYDKKVEKSKTSDEAIAEAKKYTKLRTRLNDMLAQAQVDTAKVYFKHEGKLYNTLRGMLYQHPGLERAVNAVFPFMRYMFNQVYTFMDYSPVGLGKAAYHHFQSYKAAKGDKDNYNTKFTAYNISREYGKGIVGSFAFAIGALLAALGAIRLDEDRPYLGPKLYIGDFSIDISGMSPHITTMLLGSTLTMGNGGFKTMLNNFAESVFIGDITGLIKTEAWDTITSPFENYVLQFIPALFKDVAKWTDPRDKRTESKFIRRLASSIPGLSYTVPSKIDPYTGNTKAIYASDTGTGAVLAIINSLSGATFYYDSKSDVQREAERLDTKTTGPSSTFNDGEVKVTLKGKELEAYQRERARIVYEETQKLIKSNEYMKATDNDKKKMLQKIYNEATQIARVNLKLGD